MSDAALEEVMGWLTARSAGRSAALRYDGAGWWTGEVWECGDWNYPGGGPNPLSAAVSTFRRIAGRTEPKLTGGEIDAQVSDFMQRHNLKWTEDWRIVEEASDDE